MATDFETMHAKLIEIIGDITPSGFDRDESFVCLEDGTGRVVDLEERLMGDRHFDLRMDVPPYDAGYTGPNGFTLRTDLELKVRYNDGDRARRTRKAGIDAGAITRALLNPTAWDGPNSGIDLVIPPTRDDLDIGPGDEDDNGDTVYLRMVFIVEYREES